MHFCTAFSAAVASGFHGGSQIVGSAEGGNEKGHQQGDHVLRPLPEISVYEIGASGGLGLHDTVRFFQKGRNEAKGNGHHHGQFMGRYTEPFERHEQCFYAVGEHNGAGGVSEEG